MYSSRIFLKENSQIIRYIKSEHKATTSKVDRTDILRLYNLISETEFKQEFWFHGQCLFSFV